MKRTNPWRRSDSYCPDCSAVDCDGLCTERYLAAREPVTLEPADGEAYEPREGGGGYDHHWRKLGMGR